MSGFELIGCHWTLHPHPALLGQARAAVQNFLMTRGVDAECRERTVIACDELLSNAIDHVGDGAVLSLCIRPEDVRIAVTDRRSTDLGAFTRGMTPRSGLTLVWQLSRTLYVEPIGEGKSVAAEIDRWQPAPGRADHDRPAWPMPELF